MAVLLGGRAAERLVFGDLSTCAADDLAKATDIGRRYVTRSGMSEITGQPVLEQVSQPLLSTAIGSGRRGYSEATSREVDIAVRNMLEAALDRATAVLTSRRADLEAGAMLVLERETILPIFPALAASSVAVAA